MVDTRQFANEPKKELLGIDGTLQPNSVLQRRYRITGVLGVGGMGSVYQARDLQFPDVERYVAVKEMLNPATEPELREMALKNFEREANMLAALNHPAAPTIYDYFPVNDRAYLVMEYINGKDMEAILNSVDEFLPVDMVVKWAIDLCDVLSYLHQHEPPIIFRDVKPANVMIDTFGRLRLIDFGIAKVFEVGQKGTMIGTEGYSAPEQYKGHASPRSDVYGVGATLHHILTRHDPRLEMPFTFADRPIQETNPEVPKALETVIMRALAYDETQRYQTAEGMRQELERVFRSSGSGNISIETPSEEVSSDSAWDDESSSLDVMIWKFKAEEEIRSSPIVYKKTLYVGSYDNNLYALNSADGEFIWKYPTDGGIATSPAIVPEENIIVIGSDDFYLHAVDMRTGRVRWTSGTQGPVRSSPTVAHGHIFFGSDDGKLYAVRSGTGRVAWRYDAGVPIRCRPTVSEDMVVIGSDSGDVAGLDLSGQAKWRFKAKRGVMSSPLVHNGIAYLGSVDWHVYAVDTTNGWNVWRFRTSKPVISSPILVDDKLIFGSADGFVYALDASTGRERWKFETGGQVTSSPAHFEANIYIGGIDGKLYCLDLKSGKERWSFETEKPIPGSPFVDEGVVYIGSTDHNIYALKAL